MALGMLPTDAQPMSALVDWRISAPRTPQVIADLCREAPPCDNHDEPQNIISIPCNKGQPINIIVVKMLPNDRSKIDSLQVQDCRTLKHV